MIRTRSLRAAGLAVLLALAIPMTLRAAEPGDKDRLAADIAAARRDAAEADRSLLVNQEVLVVLAETIPSDASVDLAAARERLRAAEEAQEAAAREASLADLTKRLEAARQERDAKVEEVLASAPAYRAALGRYDALEKTVRDLSAKAAGLSDAEVRRRAAARLEADRLSKSLYAARRAMWTCAAVAPLYERADALYKEHAAKAARDPKAAEAT